MAPRTCAVLALLTLATSSRAQTPSYSVLQIGPLPGHNGSFAEGVDNAGRVIGWSDTLAGMHWDAGNLVALPTLSGGTLTRAEGITDDGVVLGYSDATGTSTQAVAWFPSGSGFDAVALGIAPGDLFSGALGMGGGIIAGYSDDGLNPRPVAWLPPAQDPGNYTIEVLPFVPGDFAGGATGVDATGRAYGYTANFGLAHATRWTRTGGTWSVTNLGGLGPNFGAEVNAVAPNGVAVGYSVSPATFVEHAVLWGTAGIVDLGALNPGWRANAQGVNSQGDVVGKSGPFAYDTGWVRLNATGTMVDLNTRLPAATPWIVRSADDIADDGRIVATAERNGFVQTVLLTPVSTFLAGPTPGTAGQLNTLNVSAATPGGTVRFVWARNGGETAIAGCPSIAFDLNLARTIGTSVADAAGNASITWMIPGSLAGSTLVFQALDAASCRVTNVTQDTL
ncbi:MAG: hypothetical protein JNK02_17150 [Planctomycetes bacterium]|nr:hypothetical protein [Planctomycetota bacterium]